jgi:hypothetical protein
MQDAPYAQLPLAGRADARAAGKNRMIVFHLAGTASLGGFRMDRRDWRVPITFFAAVGSVLLGALLIAANSNSNDGSPVGWVFLALGICAALVSIGMDAGVYRD